MWAEILKSYGCAVVSMSDTEAYEAMQRGVIDAFESGPPNVNWNFGFHEVADYMGVPGIHSPGCANSVQINKDAWNALPSDLKALLEHEVQTMVMDNYLTYQYEDAKAMKNYMEYGTIIFTVPDDFQERIVADSRAICEKKAAEDAAFGKLWEQQNTFFKTWKSLRGVTPEHSIFD